MKNKKNKIMKLKKYTKSIQDKYGTLTENDRIIVETMGIAIDRLSKLNKLVQNVNIKKD